MLKNLLTLLALIAAGTSTCALEAWLDRGGFDRTSAWLLAAFCLSLIAIIIMVVLHFGGWL